MYGNLNYPTACEVLDDLGSDHLPIKFTITLNSPFSSDIINYKVNWPAFRNSLISNNLLIPKINNPDDIDDSLEFLTNSINNFLELASSPTPRPLLYKLPADILNSIKHRNNLRKQYQRTRNPSLKTQYNTLKFTIRLRIKEFKN